MAPVSSQTGGRPLWCGSITHQLWQRMVIIAPQISILPHPDSKSLLFGDTWPFWSLSESGCGICLPQYSTPETSNGNQYGIKPEGPHVTQRWTKWHSGRGQDMLVLKSWLWVKETLFVVVESTRRAVLFDAPGMFCWLFVSVWRSNGTFECGPLVNHQHDTTKLIPSTPRSRMCYMCMHLAMYQSAIDVAFMFRWCSSGIMRSRSASHCEITSHICILFDTMGSAECILMQKRNFRFPERLPHLPHDRYNLKPKTWAAHCPWMASEYVKVDESSSSTASRPCLVSEFASAPQRLWQSTREVE